ncbi:MAG: VapC toxin family PIN domain ribonuclease [Spirochaetae bacterium HGW-Spirochaetae-1]|jgi:tRNA(fMet)-specific endonuclease VapC|nr:MAG: VapC toxin family PIN domain ribonuclease [Spirochaetae bacterium HGW-Spirochaetae-1]
MSYLIDTNIIIYSIKGDSIVHDHLLKNENIPKSISVITYGELLFGAKKSQSYEKNLAIVYRIKELFPILDIDKAIIETFSELKAGLQKGGSPIDDFDLLIASTALTMNSTLVTNNEKHFNRIKGLKIENWSKK